MTKMRDPEVVFHQIEPAVFLHVDDASGSRPSAALREWIAPEGVVSGHIISIFEINRQFFRWYF
jgi:hypothetical protein